MSARSGGGGVIPVAPKPEPPQFDRRVRRPGLAWMKKKRINLEADVATIKESLPPYWRKCLDDLHAAYGGICAYVCVYIEKITGQASVDHFIAKSGKLSLAYEWDNYRLACARMNSRKRAFDDVLDPMTLAPETFYLEFLTGRVYPNPDLHAGTKAAADKTIARFGLDDPDCRDLRMKYFDDYLNKDISEVYFRKRCPFVWFEAKRQGLL